MDDDEKEQLRADIQNAIENVFEGITAPVDCSACFRLDSGFKGAPINPNPLTIDIYGDSNSEDEKPFYSVVVADVLETMFTSNSDLTGQLIPDEADFKSFRLIRDELRRLADCIDVAMGPRD